MVGRHARRQEPVPLIAVPDPPDTDSAAAGELGALRAENHALRARNSFLERLLRLVVLAVGVVDLVHGAGYALGAPATAPSLQLMVSGSGAPMWAWGTLEALAGVALLTRWRAVGFGFGGLVLVLWGGFAAAVAVDGTASGWGWPWPCGLAALHVFGLWVVIRSRRRSAAH